MEGNGCYKYSTIQNFVQKNNLLPIKKAVDIGACDGDSAQDILHYFPNIEIIHAYEVVPQLADICRSKQIPKVTVFNEAVTEEQGNLKLNISTNCKGGSIVSAKKIQGRYIVSEDEIVNVSLASVLERIGDCDYLKMDCEGCEHSVLGKAKIELLQKIRFISGEYHNLLLFWESGIQETLAATHVLNFVTAGDQGAFFAARKDESDILQKEERNHDGVIDRSFCSEYIEPGTGWWHAQQVKAPQEFQNIYLNLTDKMVNYERVGYDKRELWLGSGGFIGKGSAECERMWGLIFEDGEPTLIIEGGHGLTAKLKFVDGVWEGNWLIFERMKIRIHI